MYLLSKDIIYNLRKGNPPSYIILERGILQLFKNIQIQRIENQIKKNKTNQLFDQIKEI